ncbi:MAG TPA: RidA family protein [Sphingomicrobium sp.]|nr:RidA family protein [Sphingomicrobium sp.]
MLHLKSVGLMVACLSASASFAQGGIVRTGPAEAAIAATVALPADAKLVYVSGTVPDPIKADAPPGSVERFGDTEAQTRSVLAKIEGLLKTQGLGMGDVVMMRVFLVAPPGQARMDFAGMMRGYRAFYGTPQQPLKTARSTMQVAGLVDPDWLVEIEVTAARR